MYLERSKISIKFPFVIAAIIYFLTFVSVCLLCIFEPDFLTQIGGLNNKEANKIITESFEYRLK